MDNSEFLAALDRDGHAFATSIKRAPNGSKVASCPEWDIDDLLWHMTEVHWFWRRIAETKADNPNGVGERLERPATDALPQLYAEGLDELLSVLRAADPATPVWTWAKRKDIGFIIRRMAQETAVHRWDADLAAKGRGKRPVIEPLLASDGIDEFLDEFVNDPREGAKVDGTVHIHCTDVPGEWLVTPTAEGLITTREHAKGDAAIRGSASDLLLVLWRRTPLTSVEVIGNAAVAEQLVAFTNLE